MKDTVTILNFFEQYLIFLELAVPMAVEGLFTKNETVVFNDASIWGGQREMPWKYFTKDHDFLHPLKASSKKSMDGLCQNYFLKPYFQ